MWKTIRDFSGDFFFGGGEEGLGLERGHIAPYSITYVQTQNYHRVKLDFAVKFADTNHTLKSVIHYNNKKFQENGTILKKNKSNSGKRITQEILVVE